MTCYSGEIEYRYRVGDSSYRGTALSLGRTHWAARDAWQRVLNNYPVGKPVAVYYELGHPGAGILEPGLHGEMAVLYKLDLFFIALSGFGFLVALLSHH